MSKSTKTLWIARHKDSSYYYLCDCERKAKLCADGISYDKYIIWLSHTQLNRVSRYKLGPSEYSKVRITIEDIP